MAKQNRQSPLNAFLVFLRRSERIRDLFGWIFAGKRKQAFTMCIFMIHSAMAEPVCLHLCPHQQHSFTEFYENIIDDQ